MEELLNTAFRLLTEGNFDEASKILDDIISKGNKNPRAYLGKLMAERKAKTPDALSGCLAPLDSSKNYQAIMTLDDTSLKEELQGYNEKITNALQGLRLETTYNKGKARMAQDSLEDYTVAKEIFESLGDYKDSAALRDESAEMVDLYTPADEPEDTESTNKKKYKFHPLRFAAFVAAAAVVVAGIITAVILALGK